MTSGRLVRVLCKKETNQKVKALRKELVLKEKDIEEKDNKLNTLLQYPFSVIKLLATKYFNLRRSIEEPSNVRTRQLTEEQAADAAEEVSEIESLLLQEYGVDISICYDNNLDISDIEVESDIEDQLKKFIDCCYNNFVALLNAEEDKFTTEISEDTITFTSNEGTDTLTRKMTFKYYNGPYKKVIINGFINIGDDAFNYWINLEEVIIGDSVVSIGKDAFKRCYALTELDIGKSVKTIGKQVFAYCEALKKLVIGNSVETIGYRAFYYCTGLNETLVIPDSVKTIGEVEGEEEKGEVFYRCNGLTKIVIGKSLETIGKFTFSYCYKISPVVISDETAKQLNPEWTSPGTVSSFYGSSNPVEFILPVV